MNVKKILGSWQRLYLVVRYNETQSQMLPNYDYYTYLHIYTCSRLWRSEINDPKNLK